MPLPASDGVCPRVPTGLGDGDMEDVHDDDVDEQHAESEDGEDWEDDDWEDPEEAFARRLAMCPPAAALTLAIQSGLYVDTSPQQRLCAAQQLLWQDPPEGRAVILAMAADVNLEGEDRIAAITAAVRLGAAAQRAVLWLLARSDFAFLESEYLYRAQALVADLAPGSTWPQAYALVASNPYLDHDAARIEAAAALVNEAPTPAAYEAAKTWFPAQNLPHLAHAAVEQGILGASSILDHLVRDDELSMEVRIDAAEYAVDDPDTPEVGIEFLLDVLLDPTSPRPDRQRALSSLLDMDRDRSWEVLDAMVRERLSLPSNQIEGMAAEVVLAAYRRELGANQGPTDSRS